MKIINLDDDRNCFCGDDGDYEKWNIDHEAIIEIIRCRDCKFRYEEYNPQYNPQAIVCTYFEIDGMCEDDFCSKGEKREG